MALNADGCLWSSLVLAMKVEVIRPRNKMHIIFLQFLPSVSIKFLFGCGFFCFVCFGFFGVYFCLVWFWLFYWGFFGWLGFSYFLHPQKNRGRFTCSRHGSFLFLLLRDVFLASPNSLVLELSILQHAHFSALCLCSSTTSPVAMNLLNQHLL